jgi:hypothetical protein
MFGVDWIDRLLRGEKRLEKLADLGSTDGSAILLARARDGNLPTGAHSPSHARRSVTRQRTARHASVPSMDCVDDPLAT